MKLVIDIPEETANAIKDNALFAGSISSEIRWDVTSAIVNGMPLPKGHGDLKDADNLKHAFVMWSMAVQGYFSDADIASIIYNSQTIIEADKAESEG